MEKKVVAELFKVQLHRFAPKVGIIATLDAVHQFLYLEMVNLHTSSLKGMHQLVRVDLAVIVEIDIFEQDMQLLFVL